MKIFKKLIAVITVTVMTVTTITITADSFVKAAETAPVKTDTQENEIIPYSGTLTKSTEGRFYISINGIDMISITQYATWTYQGVAPTYPNCTTYRTVVGRMINADRTCV